MTGHDTDFLHYEVPASKLWRQTFSEAFEEQGHDIDVAADIADEVVRRYRKTFNKPDEDKDW